MINDTEFKGFLIKYGVALTQKQNQYDRGCGWNNDSHQVVLIITARKTS